MEIKISNLELAFDLLVSRIKENKIENIKISNDFFWEISSDNLYNPYEMPENMTLGQLSENIESLEEINKTKDVVAYHLVIISNLIKAIYHEKPNLF